VHLVPDETVHRPLVAGPQRWQVVVVHRPRCRATMSMPNRRRADEFVHGLLLLHGALIGDYNEDDMILHCKVAML
jgi:hypothetical protein